MLREAYGLTPPDWDRAYETRFVRDGTQVKITNSSFGRPLKILAFKDVIRRALDPALGIPDRCGPLGGILRDLCDRLPPPILF